MHVVEPPLVWLLFSHRVGFTFAVLIVPRIVTKLRIVIPKAVSIRAPGTAGIFPLRFSGKPVFPIPGQEAFLPLPQGQPEAKSLGEVPRNLFHRGTIPGIFKVTGIEPSHLRKFTLCYRIGAQPESLDEGHLVDFVILAHLKDARFDSLQFHPQRIFPTFPEGRVRDRFGPVFVARIEVTRPQVQFAQCFEDLGRGPFLMPSPIH